MEDMGKKTWEKAEYSACYNIRASPHRCGADIIVIQ